MLPLAPERSVGDRLRAIDELHYMSADLDEGRAMVQADLTQLPFGDRSFDIERLEAAGFVVRVVDREEVAPGGQFGLSLPAGPLRNDLWCCVAA